MQPAAVKKECRPTKGRYFFWLMRRRAGFVRGTFARWRFGNLSYVDFEAPAQFPAGIPVVGKAPFIAVHVEGFHGFGLYLKDEKPSAMLL
jgi:hypothetical protein